MLLKCHILLRLKTQKQIREIPALYEKKKQDSLVVELVWIVKFSFLQEFINLFEIY